jgi:hypothetical protein
MVMEKAWEISLPGSRLWLSEGVADRGGQGGVDITGVRLALPAVDEVV